MAMDLVVRYNPKGKKLSKKKLNEIYVNTIMAENFFSGLYTENEDEFPIRDGITFEVSEPDKPNMELVEYFKYTMNNSFRGFTLTPYSTEELKTFRLFIISENGKRSEAGFALKKEMGVVPITNLLLFIR